MKDENAPLIKYSNLFNRQFKAIPLGIKIAFRHTRELFLENPTHPSLRNHGLKNEFAGFQSIDITDDYRAIYRKTINGKKETLTFYLIGTHEELYGKQK